MFRKQTINNCTGVLYMNLPAEIRRKIYKTTGRMTYEAGEHKLSDAMRDKISELVFVGGWVTFVDANGESIYLSSLPNLSYVICDAKEIPFKAFYECMSLDRVDCPNATTIGDKAFDDCVSLTSVKTPSVTSIGKDAFYACKALNSVELPSVTTIGPHAFSFCESLTELRLPNVKEIAHNAFFMCFARIYVSQETYDKYQGKLGVIKQDVPSLRL